MPTKLISKTLLGALSAALMAAPAFAGGNCAGGNCAVPVHVLPSMPTQFGPLTIQNQNPLGHLRTIDFQRAPHVSITRVHGLAPTATLSDAPSGFTGGCHPSSTTYCRQGGNFAAPVNVPAPVFSAPIASAPRVVRTGGGYDASKFTPRTYGDASFVPGVAYLPTSTVVRDPAAAQQVLDTGRAVAQPVVVPGTGTAPNLGMVRQNLSFQNAPIVQNTGLLVKLASRSCNKMVPLLAHMVLPLARMAHIGKKFQAQQPLVIQLPHLLSVNARFQHVRSTPLSVYPFQFAYLLPCSKLAKHLVIRASATRRMRLQWLFQMPVMVKQRQTAGPFKGINFSSY